MYYFLHRDVGNVWLYYPEPHTFTV